jgi:hypothetical protein
MNAIMMYMSGNSLQIFSIMMVFMLFKAPIQGLINTNTVFAKFDTESTRAKLLGVKAVYVLMQLLLLALGVWKVNAMGLLPYVLRFPVALLLYVTVLYCSLLFPGDVLTWILKQDYEVRLVGLGVRTTAARESLFCFGLIVIKIYVDVTIIPIWRHLSYTIIFLSAYANIPSIQETTKASI